MSRLKSAACALTVLTLPLGTAAAAQQNGAREVRIAFVERAGDPLYQAAPVYAGLFRKLRASPFPAAELAVRDGAASGRAIGVQFVVVRSTLAESEDAAAAVRALVKTQAIAAAILDLPLDEVSRLAADLATEPIVLFNARHRDDELRSAVCKGPVMHTMPSWSMLQDALAQALLALDWRRVLVLQGPSDEDKKIAAAFQASAKKFGLRIGDVRPFVPGNDPRKRDQINVRLLTGGAEYDVVFVADDSGDFGRHVPYNTARPRPVVGTAGLTAVAWHPYWERYGAPQLNRRFTKAAGRPMADEDWAVWVAVRAVVEAVLLARDHAPSGLMETLLAADLRLELYKGAPGSIRPWSRQLRQAVLVGTADAVITLAPVDGVLHHANTLDTLGPDEPEFRCSGQEAVIRRQ